MTQDLVKSSFFASTAFICAVQSTLLPSASLVIQLSGFKIRNMQGAAITLAFGLDAQGFGRGAAALIPHPLMALSGWGRCQGLQVPHMDLVLTGGDPGAVIPLVQGSTEPQLPQEPPAPPHSHPAAGAIRVMDNLQGASRQLLQCLMR